MILYHGTTVPISSIKKYGLRVYAPDWIKDLMVSRITEPEKYLPYILEGIKAIGSVPISTYHGPGIYLSSEIQYAYAYAVSLPELVFSFIMIIPKPFRKKVLETLVETEGERLIGKVITLDIPSEWATIKGVHWVLPDEIMIPFDIGPQYIKKIEFINSSWARALEPYISL